MTFDYTLGKEPKYMVAVHFWNGMDRCYFHYYKDAKEMYEKYKSRDFEKGTAISLYDMEKDIRKEYKRF